MHSYQKNLFTLMLISMLLFIGLSGCTPPVRETATDEPWPELDEQQLGCSALSGRYNASPRIHGKTETLEVSLLAYTLLPSSPKLAGADRVALDVSEENLIVTAFNGELVLMSHAYSAESGIFECLDDSLEFLPLKKPGAAASTATRGLDWETIRLRRTVDGSLLLQKADGLASLAFMLFPIYVTSEHWYLFKPVE